MAAGVLKLDRQGKNGEAPDRFSKRMAVLEEARRAERAIDHFPIWVKIDGKENIEEAFKLLLGNLRSKGECYQDVQSDPHPLLRLANYFQVSRWEEGQREPELLGTVSLYSDGKGEPLLIKINPDCPAYSALFLEALEETVGKLIEMKGAGADLDIKISQAPSFDSK